MGRWEVEGTDEFASWFTSLSDGEREDVISVVDLLEARGPRLAFPYSSGIHGSRHRHMRELRIQHLGRPYRVLYAFDPRRSDILLLAVTRQAMIDGMSVMFPSQTACTTSTCKN